MMSNILGKVYLVGAGPGAADLITVRGAKILEQADIVFHDALVEPEMLALCPQAILIPVGKRCGKLSSIQGFINKRLVDAAHKYPIVVRLKGGDPMMFGRADEEITALRSAGVEVTVVPGITSALAAASTIQHSLSLRGVSRSVAFVTLAQGNELSIDSSSTQMPSADTLVYYMGRKHAVKIARSLIESGDKKAGTPVHILEAVSTSRERHCYLTLEELANGEANSWFNPDSPAMIMIGDALDQRPISKLDNRLQDSEVFTNSRRSA
jgi:uroporphyrin-III C-methyltransferase